MNPPIVTPRKTNSTYHCFVSRCEKLTMNWLSTGSLPGNCLNTPSNTGIRNATSASSTITAKLMTTAG